MFILTFVHVQHIKAAEGYLLCDTRLAVQNIAKYFVNTDSFIVLTIPTGEYFDASGLSSCRFERFPLLSKPGIRLFCHQD